MATEKRITTYIKYKTKEGEECTININSWDCESPLYRIMSLTQAGAVIIDVWQE